MTIRKLTPQEIAERDAALKAEREADRRENRRRGLSTAMWMVIIIGMVVAFHLFVHVHFWH